MRRASGFGETASPCDMHASICQPLTARCDAQVYANNLFHILGIPTNATARDVRRRREDLEAAHVHGKSAWNAAFPHLFPGRTIPSKDEVDETFQRLEDPQSRLIDEFFWFWPRPVNGARDDGIFAMLQGNWSVANGLWAQARHSTASEEDALIAEHNLAVFWSLKAISAEFEESAVSSDGKEADLCWEKAFKHWEAVSDSDEFWDVVSGRVLDIADPRLTTGFVRKMRQEFPISFDRINAEIAVALASNGRTDDARRQIAYMQSTHQGRDNVEATLDAVFEPMERKVELATIQAIRELEDNAANGLMAAQNLLSSTESIRKIASELLWKGKNNRTEIFDKIVTASNQCIVAYGNTTNDWESCLSLSKVLLNLACTAQLKNQLKANIATLSVNLKKDSLYGTCCVCSKRLSASNRHNLAVKMYGNLRHGPGLDQVGYSTIAVECPCCIECFNSHRAMKQHFAKHPAIREKIEKGWSLGSEPSQNEVNSFLRKIQRQADVRTEDSTWRFRYLIVFPATVVLNFVGVLLMLSRNQDFFNVGGITTFISIAVMAFYLRLPKGRDEWKRYGLLWLACIVLFGIPSMKNNEFLFTMLAPLAAHGLQIIVLIYAFSGRR